ncbi:MAG: hypothetical protein JOZ11_15330 [Alphaproteobacteria bacterium]|nr:hypothetical protein [Alphaproteobacteria bacterium]
MSTRRGFAAIGLLLALLTAGLIAGCADTGSTSDNDKRGVFYGGVTGGGTRP